MSIALAVVPVIDPVAPPEGIISVQKKLAGVPFSTTQAFRALGDSLYRGRPLHRRVILLSPPDGADGSTANLLVFARCASEAARPGDTALQLLARTT